MQSVISDLSRSVEQSRLELGRVRAALNDPRCLPDVDEATELAQLNDQLKQAELRQAALQQRMAELDAEEALLADQETKVYQRWLSQQRQTVDKEEEAAAVDRKIAEYQTQLKRLKKTNVLSEAFFIWSEGEFGCINGLRVGKKQNVPWTEVNAGVGQLCLLLDVIVKRCHVPLTQYRLLPRGSFSAIIKRDDKTVLELFTGEGGLARFFSGRKFDAALVALLFVVGEIICSFQRSDRTIRIPYKLEGDKVGGVPITLQFNTEEKWTLAMKYLLTNAKWLVTWVVEKGY